MSMTAPVDIKYEPHAINGISGGSIGTDQKRTMCFYLGSRYDANAGNNADPPAPVDAAVSVRTFPSFNVYTR